MLSHHETDKVMAMEPAVALGQTPIHVLLVEDDFALREVAGAMLSSMGYVASTARDGAEAMACIRRRSFDIVVSDVQMPGTDGLALARWIRQKAGHIRIVLMTGLHPAEVSAHMASRLADEWIFKPFSMKDMRAALQRGGNSQYQRLKAS